MADAGISAINRFFDLVDNGVEKADRILNRTKRVEEQHNARHGKPVIDTEPGVKSSAPSSSSTAIATRRFRIVESLDATTGQEIFVVTNGAAARAECTTREMAEKILRALETAP